MLQLFFTFLYLIQANICILVLCDHPMRWRIVLQQIYSSPLYMCLIFFFFKIFSLRIVINTKNHSQTLWRKDFRVGFCLTDNISRSIFSFLLINFLAFPSWSQGQDTGAPFLIGLRGSVYSGRKIVLLFFLFDRKFLFLDAVVGKVYFSSSWLSVITVFSF